MSRPKVAPGLLTLQKLYKQTVYLFSKKSILFIERLWCRVEYKEINLNGQNVFNLTMVDRVALLVSFPLEMTRFIEPAPFQYEPAMN